AAPPPPPLRRRAAGERGSAPLRGVLAGLPGPGDRAGPRRRDGPAALRPSRLRKLRRRRRAPWTNRPPGGPARPPSLPQPSIRALRRAGCPRAARTAAAVRRQRPAPRAAAFVRHARKRRRPAAVPRSCASVPSPCPTQLRRNRSRKPALSEARQPRLSVGVRLVLGQKILCLQRPLAVDAGLLRHRDRLAQRLGGLVLQRKRL